MTCTCRNTILSILSIYKHNPHLGGGFGPMGWGTRLLLQPLTHLEPIKHTSVPCLLICGTRDQFTPPDVFAEQATQLLGAALDAPPAAPPDSALDVRMVCQGARGMALFVAVGDHFWGGMWGPLAAMVVDWLRSVMS